MSNIETLRHAVTKTIAGRNTVLREALSRGEFDKPADMPAARKEPAAAANTDAARAAIMSMTRGVDYRQDLARREETLRRQIEELTARTRAALAELNAIHRHREAEALHRALLRSGQ